MNKWCYGLSVNQAQILRMLALNISRKEIAGELGLSQKTIEFHINGTENPRSIEKLLRISGTPALVRFAVEHGLVKPGDKSMKDDKPLAAAQQPLPSTERIRTTLDLAQALLRNAELAAAGKADVLQVNALCQCTDSIIDLARLQIETVDRAVHVPWLGSGGKPPQSAPPKR